ncbi:conserved hypothetical protein [Ricinus communis]|uniref:Uncharacterized protein n=1 Tax=Ricinus communis TaxID=3988 RepID=B9TDB3_RICCO|nr:conserved hypothetical protein [Ricinus communis]
MDRLGPAGCRSAGPGMLLRSRHAAGSGRPDRAAHRVSFYEFTDQGSLINEHS